MKSNIFSTIKAKLHSKLVGDVVWTFVGQVLVLLSAFALNKILSVRLDVDTFGEYNLIKRSVTVISFVMLAGTGIALPRYLAIYIGKGNILKAKTFVRASILFVATAMLLIGIIALVFKNYLCVVVVGNNNYLLYFFALVYAAVITASTLVYVYFRGKNDFKLFTISNVLIQMFLPISALVIPNIDTFSIFAWWIIITAFITFGFVLIDFRRGGLNCHQPITKSLLKDEYKTVAKYSLPRLWGDFFLFGFQAFPLVYIKQYFDYKAVSFYSVGITIITLGTAFYSFLGFVLLPYVSKCLADGKIGDAIRKINFFTIIYVLSALVVIVIFYYITPFMITLLFTTEYLEASYLVKIMILSILPQAIYLLYRNPIDAVSVFPFNTILLGLAFVALIGAFYCSNTLEHLAWAFVAVSWFQGVGSIVVWWFLKKRSLSTKEKC